MALINNSQLTELVAASIVLSGVLLTTSGIGLEWVMTSGRRSIELHSALVTSAGGELSNHEQRCLTCAPSEDQTRG